MFQRETVAPGPEAEDRGREAYRAGRVQVPDPGNKEKSGIFKKVQLEKQVKSTHFHPKRNNQITLQPLINYTPSVVGHFKLQTKDH